MLLYVEPSIFSALYLLGNIAFCPSLQVPPLVPHNTSKKDDDKHSKIVSLAHIQLLS